MSSIATQLHSNEYVQTAIADIAYGQSGAVSGIKQTVFFHFGQENYTKKLCESCLFLSHDKSL